MLHIEVSPLAEKHYGTKVEQDLIRLQKGMKDALDFIIQFGGKMSRIADDLRLGNAGLW